MTGTQLICRRHGAFYGCRHCRCRHCQMIALSSRFVRHRAQYICLFNITLVRMLCTTLSIFVRILYEFGLTATVPAIWKKFRFLILIVCVCVYFSNGFSQLWRNFPSFLCLLFRFARSAFRSSSTKSHLLGLIRRMEKKTIRSYLFMASSVLLGHPDFRWKKKKIPTTNKQYLLMAWRKWNSPRVSAFFGRKQGDFKSPRTSSKFYFTLFANAIIRATRRAPLGQNKLR